jgi:DNA-directed RNA polymerase subunit N (RpoN/RPB10)
MNPIKCFKCGSETIGSVYIHCRNAVCSMSDWAIEIETLRNYWCFMEIRRLQKTCDDHYKEIIKWRERATLEAKRHLDHTKQWEKR